MLAPVARKAFALLEVLLELICTSDPLHALIPMDHLLVDSVRDRPLQAPRRTGEPDLEQLRVVVLVEDLVALAENLRAWLFVVRLISSRNFRGQGLGSARRRWIRFLTMVSPDATQPA